MDTGSDTWWKEAVVYEIYPRSFNDSDGDGIGDIPGILEKVDYIDDLGVDVVWLCPVYDSPNADNGYDVRDYRAIHEDFGDMDDFDTLLDALHERDIRLIMDLVVNHTSDEHEWFEKSRREEAGYEDYYHWVESEPDEPPNNWESIFGGPAWAYDEVREAWYLHLFDPKQPDLNWRNPDVRDSFCEMVTWWLEKGIDGFRIDAANLLSKPDGYPDDPHTGTGQACFFDGPRIHEYLRELYDRTFANYDCMTVGEFSEITPEDVEAMQEDVVAV
ncbi:MAG: alpha-amylase family glycosyl hydrolase, partial [Halapricum sp.]